MKTGIKLNSWLVLVSCFFLPACSQNKSEAGKIELADSIKAGFTNKAEAKNEFRNGLKEGKWAEYYNSSYQPMKDSNGASWTKLIIYIAGKREGMVREYAWDGALMAETPYINGVKEGIRKEYYSSGKVYCEIPYSDGKRNGDYREFYESGKLKGEVPYTNGKISGLSKSYLENGILLSMLPFTNNTDTLN
jgi:antitoxin component YwqK of YwqJK toxin-antitoxin module